MRLTSRELGRARHYLGAAKPLRHIPRPSQHLARQRARHLSISDHRHAVDQHKLHALRKLIRILERRLVRDLLRIEDHHIAPTCPVSTRRDPSVASAAPAARVNLRIASASVRAASLRAHTSAESAETFHKPAGADAPCPAVPPAQSPASRCRTDIHGCFSASSTSGSSIPNTATFGERLVLDQQIEQRVDRIFLPQRRDF